VKVTDEGVPVNTLISAVKDSVRQAGLSRTSEARDLKVASVQLILDVIASKSVGGGLDFRVPFIGLKLSLGGKVTRKDTHTIGITLVPPENQDTRQVRGGEVEDALVNATATIRDVMTKAAEGDDPWALSAGTIDISCAVTQAGPSRSEPTANWPTNSPKPCGSDWRQARREHAEPDDSRA
jgi:hypothetical protein